MIEWIEISTCGPSQRVAEAGGSPVLEARDVGGSSPDNDGTVRYCQTDRVRQVSREGEARANLWQNPLKRGSGSNLADVGRDAVHACPRGLATPWWYFVAGAEAMRKICGVLAARLQGKSWAPTPSINRLVNVGTILGLPAVGRQARCRLWGLRWGGAFVVVRGRESRPHGEGRQRTCSGCLEGEED